MNRALPLAVLLCLPAGGLCPRWVRAETLSEYRALVSASRRAADRGLTPAEASRWGERLRGVRTVTYPDGQQVAVDNKELARTLRGAAAGPLAGRKKARDEAVARLRTLDALLSAPRQGQGAAADPRRQAADILSAEEFRRAAGGTDRQQTWWERAERAVARFLERLFGRGPGLGEGSGALGRGFIFLLYLAAAVAGVVALWTLAKTWRERRARRRRAARGGALDLAASDMPDPLRAARESAAAGDYRAALRLTYLACLRRLAAAGLLVLEDDKTNWEYQRVLRARSVEAHDTLLPVTRDFDRVWYGHAAATREEYERAVAAHDALPAPAEDAADAAQAGAAATGESARAAGGRSRNPW